MVEVGQFCMHFCRPSLRHISPIEQMVNKLLITAAQQAESAVDLIYHAFERLNPLVED